MIVAALLSCRARGSEPYAIALADDWETRGDWLGVYGRHAYILCAARVPNPMVGGPGWPIEYAVTTPREDDTARGWKSPNRAFDDGRVLWAPTGKRRIASSWDDHGEVHKLGQGPNLHVDLSVPDGTFMLSLYFFEIDWIQYRDYQLKIFITKEGKREKAATVRVSDFFDGVYKRFAVAGPAKLRIAIERGQSPNAIVSALFLDPVGGTDAYRAVNLLPKPTSARPGLGLQVLDRLAAQGLTRWRQSPRDVQRAIDYVTAEAQFGRALRAQQTKSPVSYYRTATPRWQKMRARAEQAAKINNDAELQAYVDLLSTEASHALYDYGAARQALNQCAGRLAKLTRAPANRETALMLLQALTDTAIEQGRREDARAPLRLYALSCAKWLPKAEALSTLGPFVERTLLLGVGEELVPGYGALARRLDPVPHEVSLIMGNLHYVSGNTRDAISHYEAATSGMSTGFQHRWAVVALLSCYLGEARDRDALAVYEKLRVQYPKCEELEEAQFRIGQSLFDRKQFSDAKKWLAPLAAKEKPGVHGEVIDHYLKQIEAEESSPPPAQSPRKP